MAVAEALFTGSVEAWLVDTLKFFGCDNEIGETFSSAAVKQNVAILVAIPLLIFLYFSVNGGYGYGSIYFTLASIAAAFLAAGIFAHKNSDEVYRQTKEWQSREKTSIKDTWNQCVKLIRSSKIILWCMILIALPFGAWILVSWMWTILQEAALRSRVLQEHPRMEGITLITRTSYDALLIAREIILFRHSRKVKVHRGILPYCIGVHCSESIEQDGFNPNHPDVETARECANQAEAFEIYSSNHCKTVAEQDCRSERRILGEFEQISPSLCMWQFEQGRFTRRHPSGHTYFLSYSHEDEAIADHLEVLLRRQGRLVLRDESFMESGQSLNDEIGRKIRCSDTFISIYSKNNAKSDYCRGELVRAKMNMQKFGEPARIVLALTLEIDSPIEFADYLSYKISSRPERENFVLSLIAQEQS